MMALLWVVEKGVWRVGYSAGCSAVLLVVLWVAKLAVWKDNWRAAKMVARWADGKVASTDETKAVSKDEPTVVHSVVRSVVYWAGMTGETMAVTMDACSADRKVASMDAMLVAWTDEMMAEHSVARLAVC